MTTPLTETGHAGGFILSAANGNRSFDNVTAGEALVAGQVFALVADEAVELDPADSTGGGDTPAGVIFADVAADADVAALVRHAEVNGNELVWPDGITTQQKADAIEGLAELGIIVR